jgi:uncharacterized membrane protein
MIGKSMIEEQQETRSEKETGRLEAFSDGVFAVAITLLIFSLQVPTLDKPYTSQQLVSKLLYLWPSYLAFFISFATILIMWISHHSMFKLIRTSDTLFMFANGFLLLLVTTVLFPTQLVATYLTTPVAGVACAIYAGLFLIINLDKAAVLADLTLPHSDGVVEGKVHKLKFLKRMGFGRAGFALLCQRVLHAL